MLNISILNKFACPDIHSWILDTVMILEPKLIAQAWIDQYSKSISKQEKALGAWVDDALSCAFYNDADYAFEIIEEIHDIDSNQEHVDLFSAGPLEELLTHQGSAIIGKIELKAKKDKAFAKVLGGVWQNSMQDDIWERVKKVRDSDISRS